MNRDAVLLTIAEARATTKSRARMLLERMLPVMGAPWVDAAMRAEFDAIAEHCGRILDRRAHNGLSIGETWLLLVDTQGEGAVVRLCRHMRGAEAGMGFDAEVEHAIHGLRAAARAVKRDLPPEVLFGKFTVLGGSRPPHITGSSLGLAVCVAALSRHAGRAPHSHVAGTAAIGDDGALLPVEGLSAKIRALRAQWPEVSTLVVAEGQLDVPDQPGLTVSRRRTVAEALPDFGLTLPTDGPRTLGTLRKRIAEIELEEVSPHSTDQWARLSLEAEALADDVRQLAPESSQRALLLAGQLASHAGNSRRAREVLARFPRGEQPPELVARERVLTAAALIDSDPDTALTVAQEAVARWRELAGSPGARESWLGRALGTHGRVHLHTGRLAEAEPLLRAALDEHEADPEQGPRSAVYLAQCLRHQHRTDEALALADRASRQATEHGQHDQSGQTKLYALLERGRALLELDRLDEAVVALEEVVSGQQGLAAYPSLGARRSLVRAHRERGDLEAARKQLRACVEVALMPTEYLTLRKVGAVAAAEQLRAGRGSMASETELLAAWFACFIGPPEPATIATWIY